MTPFVRAQTLAWRRKACPGWADVDGTDCVKATSWKRVLQGGLQAALGVLVLAAVGRQVLRTLAALHERGVSLTLDPGLLAASGLLYLLGLACCGAFFWRVLGASAGPVSLAAAERAYLISHLAKYVPGKAMVVVVRSGLVVPAGARAATAAFATLYETLVMMAAGGLVAAAAFAFAPQQSVTINVSTRGSIALPLVVLAALAGAGFAVLVWPRWFGTLAGWIRKPFRNLGPEVLPRLTPGLLALGLGLSAVAWVLLGLSQVAVLRALEPALAPPGVWPAVVGSVALATVAGFAVPIAPGGLGVREWVLWTSLGSAIDADRAVVAALVLRLVWVAAEVLATAMLLPWRPRAVTLVATAPAGPNPPLTTPPVP
jgi:uncharacterized membrane protein YbhN (UPF0104 family)